MMRLSVEDVEEAIEKFPPEDQRRLLAELPRLLQLSAGNRSYLKLAEPAFLFWENSDDTIYDIL